MQIVRYAHRDHVARHEVAAAKARVIAIGDNVGQPGFDRGLQYDLGITLDETREHGRKHESRHRRWHRQPQMAGRRFAKVIDRFDRRLESIEQRAQLCEQPLPGIGRRHAASGPVQ